MGTSHQSGEHQSPMKQFSRLAHLRKWHSRTTDGGTGRQAHREHRAFARLAGDGHVAAHQARELAGDGESQPSPPKRRAVKESAWANSSNNLACCSAVIPMPVSDTANSIQFAP